MDMQKTPRLSLKRRCMGPRAVSIATLVKRAETAMESVVRDYAFYASSRLDGLRRLAEEALADTQQAEKWTALKVALRDLQTSSAMAGAAWIARFAASLQGELARRAAADGHLAVLVALHLDAIRVAASGGAGDAELAELERKLELAGRSLKH